MAQPSFKTVIIEVFMLISMIAMMGHFSVNFWERFVLHTELTSMKSSLNSLKDTLYTIECAYESLQKDLFDLAEIADANPLVKNQGKDPNKDGNKNVYQESYHDYQVRDIVRPYNKAKMADPAPVTVDQKTSSIAMPYEASKSNKNISTSATLYADADTLVPDDDLYRRRYYELRSRGCDNDHASVHTADSHGPKKQTHTVNVATITRYPLKSVGAGTDLHHYGRVECSQRGTDSNSENSIHKCHKENYDHDSNFVNNPSNWKF